MNRYYVVRMTNGYFEAKNLRDAREFLNDMDTAIDIIQTRSKLNNFYHNRVKIIETK